LEKTLQALEAARFIVMDDETEELLIRSFIRNDGVWRMPKVMGAMVSGALEISSKRLQRALLAEVDRIPLDELSDEPAKLRGGGEGPSIRRQVSAHINTLRKAFRNPEPDPTEGGSATPSETPSGTPSDTPAEGGPKGSTRGRAALHVRAAPAPAPTPAPNPSPIQDASADAGDQVELVVVEDSDFVGATDTAAAETGPVGAAQIVGEWIERCAKRPPGSVIGRVGKQIKKLLDDGIAADDIRRGLALWMAKGADPSTIPSFVNQAMNAAPTSRPASNVIALPGQPGIPLTGTDAKVAGWMAIAEQLRQEGDPA
jgi:hypothetical protein